MDRYLPAVSWCAYKNRSLPVAADTRQYATFHCPAFIVNIAATLEMQTSSSEFRVLYPSLMRPNQPHFFCLQILHGQIFGCRFDKPAFKPALG